MAAIHTENYLRTNPPYRVELPPLSYMAVPEVRQAAETFVRVYADRAAFRVTVDRAQRAVYNAEAEDARVLGDAILTGGRQPKARAETQKAETALADATARQAALETAVPKAHAQLQAAVTEHAAPPGAVRARHGRAARRHRGTPRPVPTAPPPVVTLGSAGLLLLVVGATCERRRQQAREAVAWVGQMR